MKNIFLVFVLVNTVFLHAQNFNLNPITSPIINNDGSVTFRLHAPQAKSVEVKGQFMSGKTPLTKDGDGIWSVTLKPQKADIYPYNFIVDGTNVADPGNPLRFPCESFQSSTLELPDPNALYTINPVPHGKVHYCIYKSHVLNQNRNLIVYTPAEYDNNPDKTYPVLYLVSGTTDTEESWYKNGRINAIMDNLIAQGQAQPMIIVMPYGYMNMGTPRPNTMEAAAMYKKFSNELTQCVMPYVEKNYRTKPDRNHRAIAGFSRGGGQSMFTAFQHPDKFAWLGSYSAYLTPEVMDKNFPNLKEQANSFNLVWFGVGKNDFLYNDVLRNQQYFDEKNIKYESDISNSNHTWMHARYCLAETLKKFFRNQIVNKKYEGITIDDTSLPGFTIYRPSNLNSTVEQKGLLPILVWGNGACTHYSMDYSPMFAEMVANGYIVMAIGSIDGKTQVNKGNFAATGKDDDLLDAVNWICKQNSIPGSIFYKLIDISHIAAAGHSCGGAQAIAASYDPRITTTIVCNAGMGDIDMAGANSKSLEALHNPVIYLIGGEDDIAYENAKIDFKRINHIPVVSVNYPVGHGGTYKQPQGGVLGEIALHWLNWQLKGDKKAERYFKDKKLRNKDYPGGTWNIKRL